VTAWLSLCCRDMHSANRISWDNHESSLQYATPEVQPVQGPPASVILDLVTLLPGADPCKSSSWSRLPEVSLGHGGELSLKSLTSWSSFVWKWTKGFQLDPHQGHGAQTPITRSHSALAMVRPLANPRSAPTLLPTQSWAAALRTHLNLPVTTSGDPISRLQK